MILPCYVEYVPHITSIMRLNNQFLKASQSISGCGRSKNSPLVLRLHSKGRWFKSPVHQPFRFKLPPLKVSWIFFYGQQLERRLYDVVLWVPVGRCCLLQQPVELDVELPLVCVCTRSPSLRPSTGWWGRSWILTWIIVISQLGIPGIDNLTGIFLIPILFLKSMY